jgi:hypothetical protein
MLWQQKKSSKSRKSESPVRRTMRKAGSGSEYLSNSGGTSPDPNERTTMDNNKTPQTSQEPEQPEQAFEQITLTPTRGRTIRFRGEKIAQASDSWIGGREQTRWTDMRLYRTVRGRYILWIAHHTQWQGEENEFLAHICSTPESVYDHLCDPESGDMSRLASLLLHDAAEDPAFANVAIEEVE